MAELYVTYSVMSSKGSGFGRTTVNVSGDEFAEGRPLRMSQIRRIEEVVTQINKEDDPTINNLFLLDWKWLRDEAPSDAPSTTEADR